MNEKQKASAVIDYMSEWDSDTVINILQAYISDESLADLYDTLVREGLIVGEDGEEETDDDDTPEEMREALDYIRGELDEDELMIIKSRVSYNLNHRLPAASQVNDSKIIDLLEEYGENEDLPEGWWEEYGDIEDVLMKL